MRRRDLLLGASAAALTAPAAAQPVPFTGAYKRTLGPNGGSLGPVTGGTNPTIDLNFINGAAAFTTGSMLDGRITFSRADVLANASYYDATGVLRYGPTNLAFPSNAPATLLTPTAVTLTAASGTAPDGTVTMARMAETATTAIHIASKSLTVIASTVYTFSLYAQAQQNAYLQLLYDDGTAGNGVYATFDLTNGIISGAVTVRGTGSGAGASIQSVGGGIYRISVTGAIGALTTGRYSAIMSQNGTTFAQSYAGSTSNGLLIWGAQFEQATAPSPYVPTVGAVLSGPRFDYGPSTGGVTNWIRNSVMMGAAAASTAPFFWGTTDGLGGASNGITVTVVGTGTEDGIAYVDMRWQGTATASTNLFVRMEPNTQIPATNGQTWTMGVNARLTAGSLTNLTFALFVGERNLAGSSVNFSSPTQASPTNAALTTQRYTQSRTNSGGVTTAYELPGLSLGITNTQVYDFTLRIGAPQLELAASAGTFVPTYGQAVNSGATPKGLLIEEARTNLAFPSNLPATLFTPSASTLTATQGVAPDGTTTMARLAEDATTATHYANKTFTVTASGIYTFSLYAQAQQDTFLQLFYDDTTAVNGCYVNFNLTTGVISQAVAAFGAGTATGAAITAVGNGIYRCSVTGVATTSVSGRVGVVLAQVGNAGFATSFAGSTANGLLIWGAQFELGTTTSVPTSYIPTVSASQARAADVASMTLSPPATFSLAADCIIPYATTATSPVVVEIDDATTNNLAGLRLSAANFPQASLFAAGPSVGQAFSPAWTANAVSKLGGTFSAGNILAALNGTAGSPVTPTGFPTGLSRLLIGSGRLVPLNGWVRRVRYYPSTLTSTQLTQITS